MKSIPTKYKKIVHEYLGEFLGAIIFSYGIVASSNLEYGDYYIALSFFIAIVTVCQFSPTHLNMAVSIGFFASRGLSFLQLIYFWVAQLSGSFCGALLAYIITDNTASPKFDDTDVMDISRAILAEVAGTFLFVILVHYIVEKDNNFSMGYKLTSCAIALYVGRTVAFPTSGAAINPSIALGL